MDLSVYNYSTGGYTEVYVLYTTSHRLIILGFHDRLIIIVIKTL